MVHFSQRWQRPKIILIGYSFGADDLPFIVNAMPLSLKPAVARVTMMGLDQSADFQFHLASWLDVSGQNSLSTVPEIARIKGVPLQCIRGALESDSACSAIPTGMVQQVIIPGGHHLDGNFGAVAASILRGLKV